MIVFTTQEAAKLLNLEESWVRRLLQQNKLKGTKFGKAWMINEEDLTEFINNRNKKGGENI